MGPFEPREPHVHDHAQLGALPLRPLTTGEVLDAAITLLRTRLGPLLGLGFALALVEQVVLFPLRRLADVDINYLPGTGLLGPFGVLVVVGMGTEAVCIGLLGGVAATQASRALLGVTAPGRPVRFAPLAAAMLVVGTVCAASGWAFLVLPVPLQVAGLILAFLLTVCLWVPAYGLLGLVAPAVVLDRLGPGAAALRSLRLASRSGMRTALVRVLGYLVWLLVRLALTSAVLFALTLAFTSPSTTVDAIVLGATWLIVNAVAYPILGCLDTALHLDIRMRVEGLDIALRRVLQRGVSAESALAVPSRSQTPAVAGGQAR